MVLNAHVTEGRKGSIGPSWPPAPSTSDRLKGINSHVLCSKADITAFIDQMHVAQSRHPGVTRVSVRTFIDRSERTKMGPQWDGLKVEGIIPSDHIFKGAPVDMVYLGRNTPDRLPIKTVFNKMLKTNCAQTKHDRPDPASVFSKLESHGYVLERLSRSTSTLQTDLEALALLYKEALPVYMFEITSITLMDLLQNDRNIFLVVRNNQHIVSSLIAEHASLEIDGRTVSLFELSDFATSEQVFGNHQGYGLMTALQLRAIRMIREICDDEVFVYAEDRGQLPAVVRSSYNAGLTLVGALPIHVMIGGKGDPTLHEGIQGMETLLPVAWLPGYVNAPASRDVLALHDVTP